MGREIPLLYRADGVFELTDMRQSRVFEYGRDYTLDDGKLRIPEGSAIDVLTREEYNPSDKAPNRYNESGFTCSTGGYLMFAEGHEFHDREYCVTYTHTDAWQGYIPSADPDRLPLTKAKLREGKPFTFGFLGDSIATGANSSKVIGVPPFASSWPEMICERLREIYGSDITYINKSVGGTCSSWGAEVVTDGFRDNAPDILLIAFGMNDASGGVDKNVFRDNNRIIADKIREINPACELIFTSTTLPNPLANQFVRDHDTHEPLLCALADEYGCEADTARMTTMHQYLLTKKRFYDMTGNNINHPNDFLARVYAQTVLALLGVCD